MIDLRDDHLRIVRDILSTHVPALEVWAFGSRVGQEAKKHSDLDLAIRADAPLPAGVLARLRDAFSEANLPFKVDIVDWSTISEAFRRIIEEKHEIIRARKTASGGGK